MKSLILLGALVSVGCGSTSPTAPASVTPTPTPATITLSGHVTATNGGQAMSGLRAALGAQTVTTDAAGAFSTQMASSSPMQLALTGASIVPRTVTVAAASTRDVTVSAIALGGNFDLSFYQALVRDRLESVNLQPLRRWTTNLNLYLQNGADARTVDMVEAVARASVGEWSNGQVGVAAVERGTDSRLGQAGWLTIQFAATGAHCGVADVGLSGGGIVFRLTPDCACSGYQAIPTLVRHEVGHAMGFLHTDSPTDVMFPTATQCDIPITPRERYHAAIAYQRPIGNVDPDTDPSSTVNLAPMRVR